MNIHFECSRMYLKIANPAFEIVTAGSAGLGPKLKNMHLLYWGNTYINPETAGFGCEPNLESDVRNRSGGI
jgi:hypothetical protein